MGDRLRASELAWATRAEPADVAAACDAWGALAGEFPADPRAHEGQARCWLSRAWLEPEHGRAWLGQAADAAWTCLELNQGFVGRLEATRGHLAPAAARRLEPGDAPCLALLVEVRHRQAAHAGYPGTLDHPVLQALTERLGELQPGGWTAPWSAGLLAASAPPVDAPDLVGAALSLGLAVERAPERWDVRLDRALLLRRLGDPAGRADLELMASADPTGAGAALEQRAAAQRAREALQQREPAGLPPWGEP